MKRFTRAAVALFLVLLPCTGQQAAKQAKKKSAPAEKAAASGKAAEKVAFVGSEVCGTCHEDIAKAFNTSPHGETKTECESCHGPGGKHIETVSAADIRNPGKLPAAQVDETCLPCHRNKPTSFGHIEASHAHNSISCIACHSVHGPQPLVESTNAGINTLCQGCHLEIKASFAQPFRHRIPENAMNCTDCHNPHGDFRPGLMRTTAANQPGCYKCHSDKRGPFAFEHAPVREEGCESCHEPHGSSNAKMLIRQEVRLVCLECHANLPVPNTSGVVTGVVPPAFHDLNSPRYRNCTICHQKVHGSYIDRNLLR